MSATNDPYGHGLLAERIAAIPGHLVEMLAAPPVRSTEARQPRRVVATGIGSSEAHARHLAWLLNNFTDVPAEFTSLAAFAHGHNPDPADRTLAVFSQGLSRNARLALDQRARFDHTVLFTAATEAGLTAGGKPDRAELLGKLRDDGVEIVPFGLEDEFSILIRTIGPACGFLAARRWVQALRGHRLPTLHVADVVAAHASATASAPVAAFTSDPSRFAQGFLLLASPALVDCAHNLACKFVEGVFWPAPQITDLLAFAHGPFQQLAAAPRPVVIIHDPTPCELDLRDRAVAMCAKLGVEPVSVLLTGSRSLAPLEAEALFNPVILALIRQLGIGQRNWPGKGLDAPLYAFP